MNPVEKEKKWQQPQWSLQTGQQPTGAAWAPAVAWGQENRNLPVGMDTVTPGDRQTLPSGMRP